MEDINCGINGGNRRRETNPPSHIRRHTPVLHGSLKDNLRLCAAKALQLADKVVELQGCPEQYFDQHGIVAGDTAALHNIGDFLDKGIEFLLLGRLHLQVDEGFDVVAEEQVVHLGMIAGDDACFFHALDAGGDGGRGEENLPRDVLDRHPGISLEQIQYLFVDGVKLMSQGKPSFVHVRTVLEKI